MTVHKVHCLCNRRCLLCQLASQSPDVGILHSASHLSCALALVENVHPQHKENLRVTVEGANNGGLLSRMNGLSLFVPVSQLEKRGQNEWWTEQARCNVQCGCCN